MSHLKFFTKPGIISPFLFNSFTTNKPGLMFAVISCNNKVDTSVNTYNITNIRNITFFNLIGNWYMQIIFTIMGIADMFLIGFIFGHGKSLLITHQQGQAGLSTAGVAHSLAVDWFGWVCYF